ncbi:hypothetical protein [Pseudomonas chlororaphis]|uniref:hypothetical protein n=1 Tax=Pseudomonas chlororaphis TaxID=587753 RepID=UPI000F585580|nr:hypothetical protein [Pseudomonas chlororaphis]
MTPWILGGLWTLLAAAAGAIIPMALVENLSRKQRLIYMGVGMLTAIFIAPGIVEYVFQDAGVHLRGTVAFLTGLVGLKLTKIIMQLVDRRGKVVLNGMADAVLPRPRQDNSKGD